MVQNKPIGFEISVSGRGDGTLEAAYIRFRRADVARSEELEEDVLVADYDAKGNLIGLEILGPVKLSDLAEHVDQPMRRPFKKFIKASAPAELVTV